MQYILTQDEFDNHNGQELGRLRNALQELEGRATPKDCPHNFYPPESSPRKFCSGCPLSNFPNEGDEYVGTVCTKKQHYGK